MDIKLRGPRIAVSDVEGVNTTGLHFPENSQRAYVFGEVIALGDNVISTGKAPYHFSVGDIIVFQANPMMMANCRFEVNKKKMLVMLQGDALAKLTNGQAELNLGTIEMAGGWVLMEVRTHDKVGDLYIPDSAKATVKAPTFHLVKAGKFAGLPELKPGTELIVERARATAMMIGTKRYAYITSDYVYGYLDGEAPVELKVPAGEIPMVEVPSTSVMDEAQAAAEAQVIDFPTPPSSGDVG